VTRAALVLAVLCGPATAADFAPPPGCATWMTVQSRSCRVANYYRCDGDAAGDQHRASFDLDGLVSIGRIDTEAQWVETFWASSGTTERLDPDPVDPQNLTELLQTGLDRADFTLSDNWGERTRIVGFGKLTGRSVEIDGITLIETEFLVEEFAADGRRLFRKQGREYVHAGWRRFFGGLGERDWGEGAQPYDDRPVGFIFPGEPGFAATEPVHDCDAALSSLPGGGHVTEVVHGAD
jgi:hypothetical protein